MGLTWEDIRLEADLEDRALRRRPYAEQEEEDREYRERVDWAERLFHRACDRAEWMSD